MKHLLTLSFSSLLSVASLCPVFAQTPSQPAAVSASGISFGNEELVVLLGDGMLESEGTSGLIEHALLVAQPEKNIRFRNLSWSGDTPRGESRSYFGPPEEGFQRLQKMFAKIKPTTVILNFGSAAAGDSALTPEDFSKALERLIESFKQASPNTKLVLLEPIPRQEVGRAKEAIIELNTRIDLFSKMAQRMANSKGLPFLALEPTGKKAFVDSQDATLTAYGAVLTPKGYEMVSTLLSRAILGKADTGRDFNKELLKAIQKKNELFFNQWRPANEIYLFGSRKHEQGNNAVEIPQFDPLIEAAEAEIRKLKAQPLP